jgi:hypothetical protein
MVHGSESMETICANQSKEEKKVATLEGYEGGTARALTLWQETYGTDLSLCLTDTYSSEVFFKVRFFLPVISRH